MDFSLSSSLVGNAVLSADKLALDLQFALDKTLTARKGPTPVFTRGSTGRFVGSNGLIQSAAINAPRFDHDPVTGVCKGLLMEEARTNICLQSENFGTFPWAGTGRTISLNAATAPDGSTTADKIVEGTNNGLHGAFQILNTVSGSTYIGSMYVKAAGRDFATIYTGASPANGRFLNIPADGTGAVLGLFNANPSTVTMRYVGNGWYLVTILIVASATGTSLEMYPSLTATVNSYTGDGTSGILVWGAQVELGSFPTSYIPTTTASVVRSADVCSIIGSDFSGMWNATEGTIYASFYIYRSIQIGGIVTAGRSGIQAGRIEIGRVGTNRGTFNISDDTGLNRTYLTAGLPQFGKSKAALAYRQNDVCGIFNTSAPFLSTDATLGTQNELVIGNFNTNNRPLSGAIDSIRIYRKRLPLAKLQGLTK